MANSIQGVENAINDGKHVEIKPDGTVNVGAAEAISQSILKLKSGGGYGFGTAAHLEQARVLRVLADQVEKKEALIQAVTFDVTTDVADFRLFTYTVRFAEKTP